LNTRNLSKFWVRLLKSFAKSFALIFIAIYRSIGTAWLGGACRFEPSCSEYAAQAFSKLPFWKAFFLSVHRISKCRPGGGCGYDPLPNCRGHHE
jgi:putative membrane protein insertion efficiency factor